MGFFHWLCIARPLKVMSIVSFSLVKWILSVVMSGVQSGRSLRQSHAQGLCAPRSANAKSTLIRVIVKTQMATARSQVKKQDHGGHPSRRSVLLEGWPPGRPSSWKGAPVLAQARAAQFCPGNLGIVTAATNAYNNSRNQSCIIFLTRSCIHPNRGALHDEPGESNP